MAQRRPAERPQTSLSGALLAAVLFAGVPLVGPQTPAPTEPAKKQALQYIPNAGFLLVEGDKGEMYAPLFAKLTPEASEKLRKGNYERLFDAARLRVRAWEKANPR